VATVTVSFTPLPAHVRTARFVAASVARRAGVADALLDEIRLAVSEACSLAVRFHLAHAPAEPVHVRLTDSSDQFMIEVADAVARPALDLGSDVTLDLDADLDLDLDGPTLDADGAGGIAATDLDLRSHERIGLAVINGLVDDVSVGYLDDGSVVTMRWPIA
jgi:serine/threonine-protein kinase RsbW